MRPGGMEVEVTGASADWGLNGLRTANAHPRRNVNTLLKIQGREGRNTETATRTPGGGSRRTQERDSGAGQAPFSRFR
ncbi:hypothetical protein GCM10022207_03290 [Streptomyces lannensis]|uniref:Uncharacterized protein n=1 Tax=Streptomyces lannensis TaxID=766498 RepID=A0ABP7JKM4_9ACTN